MLWLLRKMVDFIYPPRCPCCDEVNYTDKPCEDCADKLVECRIAETTCKKCGMDKKNCECKRYNYLFDGVVGAFYNKGVAQNGVYGIKLGKRPYAAGYFGRCMGDAFLVRFKGIKPDIVCAVPMSDKRFRETDFNHADLLAKSLAKRIGVSYKRNVLIKVKDNKSQHKLTAEERRANVKGVYKAKTNLDGKTVLLVDDIKTTGMTLNECAKQLRLAGAERVYCAVALISAKGTCKNEESKI